MDEKWQDPRLVEARRELHKCYQALDGHLNSGHEAQAQQGITDVHDALFSLAFTLKELHP
jgi:hypothetical protein